MSATCHRCQGPAPLASDGYHRCQICTVAPSDRPLTDWTRIQLYEQIRADADRVNHLLKALRRRIKRGRVTHEKAMRGVWYEEPRPGVWRVRCPPAPGGDSPRVLGKDGAWHDGVTERVPFASRQAAEAAALVAKEWWEA